MADQESTGQRIRFSEVLFVGAAPFVGYWLAYLYEGGYCTFLGVPWILIEVGMMSVLSATVGVVVFLVVVQVAVDILYPAFAFLPSAVKWALTRSLVPALLIGAMHLVTSDPILTVMKSTIMIACIFIGIHFLYPMVSQRRVEGFVAKLEAESNSELAYRSIGVSVAKKVGRRNMLAALIFGLLSFSAYLAGGYAARTQEEFIVTSGPPARIVIKKYGDMLLAADFDSTAARIVGPYRLMPANETLGAFTAVTIDDMKPLKMRTPE